MVEDERVLRCPIQTDVAAKVEMPCGMYCACFDVDKVQIMEFPKAGVQARPDRREINAALCSMCARPLGEMPKDEQPQAAIINTDTN